MYQICQLWCNYVTVNILRISIRIFLKDCWLCLIGLLMLSRKSWPFCREWLLIDPLGWIKLKCRLCLWWTKNRSLLSSYLPSPTYFGSWRIRNWQKKQKGSWRSPSKGLSTRHTPLSPSLLHLESGNLIGRRQFFVTWQSTRRTSWWSRAFLSGGRARHPRRLSSIVWDN